MDKYVKEAKTMVKGAMDKSPPTNSSTPPSPPIERINSNLTRKELKLVTKRKTLVHPVFYIKFFKGVFTFLQGSWFAIRNKKIMGMYLQTLKYLLIGIAATYFIMIMTTFPVRLFLHFLSGIGFHHVEVIQNVMTPFILFEKIAFFIPMIFIGFLRYVLPSFNEDMFFNVLDEHNKDLSLFLRKSPVLKQYPMSDFLWRFAKLAASGVIVYLLSLLPYGIGPFAVAASQFIYSKEPLGQGMAFVLAMVSLHPAMHDFSKHSVKALMACYSMGKELLEVYYCRVPDVKQEVYVNRRYFGWLFGFSLTCTYILAFPYLGPSLWGITQGSAAILLIRILERNQFKEQNDEHATHLFGQDYCKPIKSE